MIYPGAPTIKWLPAGAGFVAEITMDGLPVANGRVRITPNTNDEGWAYTIECRHPMSSAIEYTHPVSTRTLRGCKAAAASMIRRAAWVSRYDNPPPDVLGALLLPTGEPPPIPIPPLVTVKWSGE